MLTGLSHLFWARFSCWRRAVRSSLDFPRHCYCHGSYHLRLWCGPAFDYASGGARCGWVNSRCSESCGITWMTSKSHQLSSTIFCANGCRWANRWDDLCRPSTRLDLCRGFQLSRLKTAFRIQSILWAVAGAKAPNWWALRCSWPSDSSSSKEI